MGITMDARERIIAFIPEYVCYLLNRLHEGSDGKTPYERSRGKRASILGLEFGERVLFKIPPKQKMAKIEARWTEGVFVGVRRRSNEVIVSDE